MDKTQVAIQVTDGLSQYNCIRQKYLALANKASRDFDQRYSEFFKDMDSLHENCSGVAGEYFKRSIQEAVKDLVSRGATDVNEEYFVEKYMEPYSSWDDYFSLIDDQYNEIVMNAEELDAHRTGRRQGRGQWVGGGFGIEGAIKGAATAAAANAAMGVLHGTFNLGAKAISAVGDVVKKKAIFDDPDTRRTLVGAVQEQIFDMHLAVVDAINERSPSNPISKVAVQDVNKAQRLLENVKKGRVAEGDVGNILQEALSLNPYDPEIYLCWMERFGDKDGVIENTARYFGVQEVDKSKRDLLWKKLKTIDVSTPAACQNNFPLLEQYALSIGYVGFEEEKARLLADAERRDREKRTAAGKIYATAEEAQAVRTELESRTFNDVLYPTKELAEKERDKKKVGLLLGLGILFMPYIFPFVTLRKGYSPLVRCLAFGYLALFAGPMIFNAISRQSEPVSSAVAGQAAPAISAEISPPSAPVVENKADGAQAPVTAQSIAGKWVSEGRIVEIEPHPAGFVVSINVSNDSGCAGNIEGAGVLTGSDLKVVRAEDGEVCTVDIKFSGNSAEMSESNCLSFHGTSCGFFGGLKKGN